MEQSSEAQSQADNGSSLDIIEKYLRLVAVKVPGSIKFRLINSLDHFCRSLALLETDREIASFRAISGKEEAASALIKAIQLRRYAHADKFNARSHQHKAAVKACVMAIAFEVEPMLQDFQLTFDFNKRRVDVKIPLSNFNVAGGERLAIQPVEPLDLVHTKSGTSDAKIFDDALENLASRLQFGSIKELVSAQANARNTSLYASDSSLPQSKASQADLKQRKRIALILLVLAVMVPQSRKHQSLVRQAISAFLRVISRLPREDIDTDDG